MIKKISIYIIFFLISFSANSKDYPSSFANLAERLMPSVVNISTTQVITTKSNPFPFEFPPGSPFEDMFRDFGEPFYISDVYKILNSVQGVVDTKNVMIIQREGGNYSPGFFDIDKNTVDGRYIVCPADTVFEMKFPNTDIIGSVV